MASQCFPPCRILLLASVMLASSVLAGESRQGVDALDADRVLVKFGDLPIALSLAHLDAPADAADRQACKQRLSALVKGRPVDVQYQAAFGTDRDGGGYVHLMVIGGDVAETLIGEGLARYKAGSGAPALDRALKSAEDGARSAKKGLWAKAAPTTVAARPGVPAPTAATAAKGDWAAELSGRYYYRADDRALAGVNAQRLIYYKDEAAAKKAGKQPAPAAPSVAPAGPATLAAADSVYAVGEDLYRTAISKGNTDARDQFYEQAFAKLSEAVQLYGSLVEKDENNDALAEKLRRAMQLRYGAMKQRRPH